MDADREIDRLFELEPQEFVAARDDLARRLRAAGDRDAARAVAGLRRPSVAAWVVNRLVRQHRERFEALVSAGGELEQAQRRVLSGLGSAALREVSERRRALLGDLRREVTRTLRDAGRGEGHVDAAVATLEAASVDPDAAQEVGRARLERELPPPSGFGGLGGLTVVRDAGEAPGADETPGADEQPGAAAGEREREAEHREREAEQRRREAEQRRREAEQRLAAATQAARDAEREADRAERERAAAEEAAEQLERKAGEARREADRAGKRLEKAAAALERARREVERRADELEAAVAPTSEDSPARN